MLATTNELTQEQLNQAVTFEFPQAFTLTELCDKRALVESRGIPEEYESLANEYASIGAHSNASSLRVKAAGMRARM